MGLALGLQVASTLAGVGSVVKANKEQKRASRAARTENEIRTANETFNNRLARRKALRESRIRRARIQQFAENAGVGTSSGTSGATSAISSNLGGVLSSQSANTTAVKGINEQVAIRGAATTSSANAAAFSNLAFNLSNFFGSETFDELVP